MSRRHDELAVATFAAVRRAARRGVDDVRLHRRKHGESDLRARVLGGFEPGQRVRVLTGPKGSRVEHG